MSSRVQAVVAGHICLDIIPTFAGSTSAPVAWPGPGQLLQIGPAILSTGGPVPNTGLALHHLGVATRLIGKIGADSFGRTVLDLIRARDERLAEGIVVAPGETTSYSIVLNLPDRDRSFLHCPGANDTFCAADLNLDEIAPARLFHFGYPPVMACMFAEQGRELVEMFRKIKALQVTTSLDMAMVDPNSPAGRADWESILQAALPYVDLFLPSVEEMLLLVWRTEYDRLVSPSERSASQGERSASQGDLLDQITPALLRDLSTQLLDWGVKVVAFKLGRRGLYLRTATAERMSHLGRAAPPDVAQWSDRELWAPVFQVSHLAGTTGAGDATIAGFLAALLAGRSPEETLAFACGVGASSIEASDALGGIKTWEETWARIRAGWPRVPLALDDPGWRLCPAGDLWTRGAP